MKRLTENEFEKHLALYGPRIMQWPLELRRHLVAIQGSPTRQAKVIEAHYVEEILLGYRPVETPSADLATRIIHAARATHPSPKTSIVDTVRAVLEFLMPHPAAAFASVLILGLVMGLSVPNANPAQDAIMHSDMDTGDIL